MKSYIIGYYTDNPKLDLPILNSKKYRQILDALIKSYPLPKTIPDIAKDSRVNTKTVRSYWPKLETRGFVKEQEEAEEGGGGKKYVIENVNRLFAKNKKYEQYRLAPGNVAYSPEFEEGWNHISTQEQIEPLKQELLKFIKFVVRRATEEDSDEIKKLLQIET